MGTQTTANIATLLSCVLFALVIGIQQLWNKRQERINKHQLEFNKKLMERDKNV